MPFVVFQGKFLMQLLEARKEQYNLDQAIGLKTEAFKEASLVNIFQLVLDEPLHASGLAISYSNANTDKHVSPRACPRSSQTVTAVVVVVCLLVLEACIVHIQHQSKLNSTNELCGKGEYDRTYIHV
jgi:hypothetical protein